MSEPKGILIVPVGFNPDDDVRAITVDADDYLNVVLNAGLTGGGMGKPKGKLATIVGFNPDGDVRALELDANDNLIVTLLVDAGADEDDVLTNKSGEASWEAPAAGGYTEGARVYNSEAIALAHGATVLLTFDNEVYDTDAMHSVLANTSRLTCVTEGLYLILAQARFEAHAGGNMRYLALHYNDDTIIAQSDPPPSGDEFSGVNVVSTYQLSVDDYVEVKAYQDSGVELDIQAIHSSSPVFIIQRIG